MTKPGRLLSPSLNTNKRLEVARRRGNGVRTVAAGRACTERSAREGLDKVVFTAGNIDQGKNGLREI